MYGAWVDWDRLIRSPILSSGEIAAVHIARGCALAERIGGLPDKQQAARADGDRTGRTGHSEDRRRRILSRTRRPIVPAVGSTVRIRGKRGIWTVRGTGKDGSVTVTGGPAGQWRSVMPDRIVVVRPRRIAISR